MQLKELKDLLKLLRKEGVMKYQTPELTLELSEHLPEKTPRNTGSDLVDDEPAFEDLSLEEQLMYSAVKPSDTEQ